MINYKALLQNRIVKSILEWVKVVIIAFALAIVVKFLILETDIISGISMKPTFEEGQRVLVEKLTYKFTSPDKGDVIIFNPNGDTSKKYIKRILGTEGDVIDLKDGKLYVNDKAVIEDYINGETYKLVDSVEFPLTVGKDEFFVLGDNRYHSEDSRSLSLGLVKKENIVGKVWIIVYPFDKIQIIK